MLTRPEEEKHIINSDTIKAFYHAVFILSNAKEDETALTKTLIKSADYIKKNITYT